MYALVLSLWLIALSSAPLVDLSVTVRSAAAEETGGERGVLTRIVPQLARASRQLSRALESQMREASRDGAPALVGLVAIAAVCGAVQAAGPGHGKVVIASAFLTADIRYAHAVGIAAVLSILQSMSAVAAVVLIGPLLAPGRSGAVQAAALVELASYALALVIGVVGTVSALSSNRRARSDGRRGGAPRATAALLLTAAVIPSAGGLTLALAAVAHGTLVTGAVGACGMAAGAGLTLGIVAVAGVAVRRALIRLSAIGGRSGSRQAIAVLGWLAATCASAAFAWSAWMRIR